MSENQTKRPLAEVLTDLAGSGSPADRIALGAELDDLHAVDIAQALSDLPEASRFHALAALETELRADVLSEMPDIDEQMLEDFLETAPVDELAEVVDEMEPDDAVDLLDGVEDRKAEAVIDSLDADHAAEVRKLRTYDSETAGGIMTTEFVWARVFDTREDISKRLRTLDIEIEGAGEVFVGDEHGRLMGALHATDLLAAEPGDTVGRLMDRGVVHVPAGTDQEVCAHLMRRYDLSVLPVVDEHQRMIGIITYDDILDVLDDEAQEDMYRLAGVGDNKALLHGPWERAFKRLPWLATTLIGMGLVGPVLLHVWFQSTLEELVVLAFFIPAIMGIGGNTAIQSSTITVRGLATGEIKSEDLGRMLRREVGVALIIAVVCALVITAFAYGVVALGFESSPDAPPMRNVAFTVGIAMFLGVMVSVLVGTATPMLCHRYGVDPAVASGPFITTVIDIGTQIIYLGLATWVLLA
jgi:magnesium transporter